MNAPTLRIQRKRTGNYRGNPTHGQKYTSTYCSWSRMIQRAHTGSAACAKDYIGRGIAVCERWLAFEHFLADMGPRPPGLTLERVNNDGNYEPGNCRWATVAEQNSNKRSNNRITAFGRTLTITEWAAQLNVSRQAITWRLRAGWTPEEAVGSQRSAP